MDSLKKQHNCQGLSFGMAPGITLTSMTRSILNPDLVGIILHFDDQAKIPKNLPLNVSYEKHSFNLFAQTGT